MNTTSANIDTIERGDCGSCRMTVTEAHVDAFAKLSLDDNPLHMNEGFARTLGFRGRVAHGMIALGTISRLIGTQLPGHGSLWISQEVEFVTPVFVGDTLEAQVTVEKISVAARLVVLSTQVVNSDTDEVVLRGSAKVRIPNAEMIPDRTIAMPLARET